MRGHPTIPTRWLNNFIALFLIPPAGILTQALFTSFAHVTQQHAFWFTEEFWFFTLGALVWTIAFLGSLWVYGEPRPLRIYVFGHELTHAIMAKAMGGKVFDFRASRNGGYVITDKSNFWIALARTFGLCIRSESSPSTASPAYFTICSPTRLCSSACSD